MKKKDLLELIDFQLKPFQSLTWSIVSLLGLQYFAPVAPGSQGCVAKHPHNWGPKRSNRRNRKPRHS